MARLSVSFAFVFCLSISAAHGIENPALDKSPKQAPAATDPHLVDQWYIHHIGADRVWERYTEGSPKITVGVVDSGVEYNHPEIAANIKRDPNEIPNNGIDDDHNGFIDDVIGWDFVLNKNTPYDRAGHGMFMSTIIAGIKDNGIGGSGICPKCTILPVRFMNYDGLGDDEDSIKGIYYAAKKGVSVMNLSFAGEGKDESMEKALKFTEARDIVVVIASANDHENLNYSSVYPAKYNFSNTITVAACDRDDKLIYKSNWGSQFVHLCVPGDNISGIWLGEWDHGDGTSDATAVMSGSVALLRSAAPRLSAAQVKQVILRTVRKNSFLKDKVITGGALDLEAAIDCATQETLPCLRGKGKGKE